MQQKFELKLMKTILQRVDLNLFFKKITWTIQYFILYFLFISICRITSYKQFTVIKFGNSPNLLIFEKKFYFFTLTFACKIALCIICSGYLVSFA